MPIQFACPHCQRQVQVGDQFAGRMATCPTCKGKATVPLFSTPPAPPEPSPFSFTPPPASAGTDANPFGFTQPPPPPALDEGPPPDLARAVEWDTVRRGLRYAWFGTIILAAAPLIFLVTTLVGQVVLGSSRLSGAMFNDLNAAPPSSAVPGTAAGIIVLGGQVLIAICVLVGPIVRIAGFVHCIAVPAGAPGKGWAWAALLCETIMLLGFGASSAIWAMLLRSLAVIERGVGFPWAGRLGWLALIGGVVCMLLYVHLLGKTMASKPLASRVTNFAIWFAASLGLLVLLVAAYLVVGERVRWVVVLLGILYYVTLPALLLLKYLILLDLAWDEVRKRAAKWRPAE